MHLVWVSSSHMPWYGPELLDAMVDTKYVIFYLQEGVSDLVRMTIVSGSRQDVVRSIVTRLVVESATPIYLHTTLLLCSTKNRSFCLFSPLLLRVILIPKLYNSFRSTVE